MDKGVCFCFISVSSLSLFFGKLECPCQNKFEFSDFGIFRNFAFELFLGRSIRCGTP